MIVEPRDDVVVECYTGEEVNLQCELSRSTGAVRWYKDGVVVVEEKEEEVEKEVEKEENRCQVRLTCEGPYRRLSIRRAGPQDAGEYVCDTDGDSVFFQLHVAGNQKDIFVCVFDIEQGEKAVIYFSFYTLEI